MQCGVFKIDFYEDDWTEEFSSTLVMMNKGQFTHKLMYVLYLLFL